MAGKRTKGGDGKTYVMVGLLGWLPLLAALGWTIWPDSSPLEVVTLDRLTIGYGVALTTFLAGVRLGALLTGVENLSPFDRFAAWSALLGLAALALPYSYALAVLIVGFGAQGALDVWAGFRGRLPEPYVSARKLMTWLVCATLIGIFLLKGMVVSV